MTTKPTSLNTKKLREIIAVLSVEFILGVALTTVIDYNQAKTTVVQNIVLGAHFVLACYLLFISSRLLLKAYRQNALVTDSWVGLVAIVAAFGSGGYAAQSGNDWAIFVMAISFIVALLAYGASLVRTKSA